MSLPIFCFRNLRNNLSRFGFFFILFLISFFIFWLFFPLYFWNDLPKSKVIQPDTFTLSLSDKNSLILKILTHANVEKNKEEIYIFDLMPQNVMLFRDIRGSVVTRSAETYMMFCKDVNGKTISFPIMIRPPAGEKANMHNFLFNEIYIGDDGFVKYLLVNNKNDEFYKRSPEVSRKGSITDINAFWNDAYEKFPQFRFTMRMFNQKIVNAYKYSSLCINIYNRFDFFIILSGQFHALTSIVLYAYFLIAVRGTNIKRLNAFYKPPKLRIKFTDIAGNDEEKMELIEIVDYLKNPQKYKATGARTPKGVLLYGPPGTGKTLLAKAVAGEAGVAFFQTSGASFDESLVGVGARRVRDLFLLAKYSKPAIIFIDEIDAVISRDSSTCSNHQTMNELLTQMDGFNSVDGVVVIAASNRINALDKALLRPGRFDRKVFVDLPNLNERIAILQIHAKNKNLSPKIDLLEIAKQTTGFSGAELFSVMNEAAILALREQLNNDVGKKNKDTIDKKIIIKPGHISSAIDRVSIGIAKSSWKYNEKTKKLIATHEVGHALVGLYSKTGEIIEKITIIPHADAGGFTRILPKECDFAPKSKTALLDIIAHSLGGRAAEFVKFGSHGITSGAVSDLEKASEMATNIVKIYGMSNAGMRSFSNNLPAINCSQTILTKVDEEIEKIIQNGYRSAINIIKNNMKEFDLFVEALIKCETLLKDDIYYIHKNKKLPQK